MTSDPGKVVCNFVSYTTLVLVVRPGLVAAISEMAAPPQAEDAGAAPETGGSEAAEAGAVGRCARAWPTRAGCC